MLSCCNFDKQGYVSEHYLTTDTCDPWQMFPREEPGQVKFGADFVASLKQSTSGLYRALCNTSLFFKLLHVLQIP